MKIKKLPYGLLALSFLAAVLFSCGSAGDNNPNGFDSPADSSDFDNSDNVDEKTDNSLYNDDLPEFDFNGEKFKMLTFPERPDTYTSFIYEEQTGDIVEDSVYLVNRTVEARFNIEFEQMLTSSWNDMPDYVRRNVRAGDYAYDFVNIGDRLAMNLAMEGKFFHPMNELTHVNLEKLYWDQNLQKDMSVGNVLYFTYGSNMLSTYDYICLLIFNKQIASDFGLENMYNLVREGKWTIDKMYQLGAEVVTDLNGDGVMNKEDRYGVLMAFNYYYPGFWAAERLPLIDKDENDLPYFNVPGNEKLFAIFDKLYDYAHTGIEFDTPGLAETGPFPMFIENRGLFANATMYTLKHVRGMEVDYGILPYPTLDEIGAGAPYSARLCVATAVIVPVTANPDRASVILEALACEYEKRVVPNYLNISVQVKGVRDDESIEMLQMMINNRFVDLGDTVWLEAGRANYEQLFKQRNNTFQSVTEKITGKVEKTLSTAIEAFRTAGGQ
ncbi:MAG: hypothetical protein FWD23_13200 [Oscillospiraceae bacterium]|nr:hypothetical protein [Oscillospiraceae bacterium]